MGAKTKLTVDNLNLFYGNNQALHSITTTFPSSKVTALIGPSGCGKSSLLRCLNRMNDYSENCNISGKITLDHQDIYDLDPVLLRMKVGMVFQRPNPFPKSIFDNVAYGPRLHGMYQTKAELEEAVHLRLKQAGLYEEVKDRLHSPALGLSGGQQQRLCIARALSVSPEVILMDEPCSALDPIATAVVENFIIELGREITIVIVTHSMQQAARVSDKTVFFYMGKLVEEGNTEQIFTAPQNRHTQDYIMGKVG